MPVSLLPRGKVKKAERAGAERRVNKRPIYIGLAILLLIVVFYAWSEWYAASLKGEAERTRARAVDAQRQGELAAEDEVRAFSTRLDGIDFLLDNPTLTSKVFEFLEKKTHPKAQFTDFSFRTSTGEVILGGATESYKTFGEQFYVLENDENISALRIVNITLGKSGQVVFNISFKLAASLYH